MVTARGRRRSTVRWALATALALFGAGAATAQQALTDPIPDAIVKGHLTVALEPFVQAPRTEDPARFASAGTNDAAARIQYLLPVPGTRWLAFNDIRGILYLTGAEGGAANVYLDLRERNVGFSNARSPNEAGFMGFAFHPHFAAAGQPGYGKLYTAFSATPQSGIADFLELPDSVQESVVREWTAEDPSAEVFRGSSREVLRVGQFAANHNVGSIAFNPTGEPADDFGLLYLGFGDGGDAHDPRNHGQRLTTPLGAILRIDPLEAAGRRGYGIPASNPFVGRASAVEEIWAYGLRHPQQFSWDVDGRMFISDIGQNRIEEVNLGEAGGNYGWRLREGTFATGREYARQIGPVYPRPPSDAQEYLYPLAQYDHHEGLAIGGGYVYRGAAIPYLQGKYVFTDFPRGRIFAFDVDDAEAAGPARIEELRLVIDGREQTLADVAGYPNTYLPGTLRVDARLGIDHEGELYLLTKGDGWVRKLVAHGLAINPDAARAYWTTRRDWHVCQDGSVVPRGQPCIVCEEDGEPASQTDSEGCPAPDERDSGARTR